MQAGTVSRLRFCRRCWGLKIYFGWCARLCAVHQHHTSQSLFELHFLNWLWIEQHGRSTFFWEHCGCDFEGLLLTLLFVHFPRWCVLGAQIDGANMHFGFTVNQNLFIHKTVWIDPAAGGKGTADGNASTPLFNGGSTVFDRLSRVYALWLPMCG